MKRLRDGFPISLRLVRELHEILLGKGRGSRKQPGEFRTSQNWIGGTRPGNARFVPPPADEVPPCLDALEKFLHNQPAKTSPLLKAGLAHVQFETIHPFLDGNGRVGRLLITLLLCAEGVLREPLLYLSLFFKQHRSLYYDLLNQTRETGEECPETRIEVPITVEEADLDACCKFTIALRLEGTNCCNTYTQFSINGPGGEVFSQSFGQEGLTQSFDIRDLCNPAP